VKPVSLARAPQDVEKAGTARMEKDRVLHRALDERYFRVEMEPGVGGLRGTSVVDSTAFTYEDFPPGAITVRRRTRATSDLWPKCGVRLNVWYTSPVGSIAPFTVNFNVRQLGAGVNLTAPSLAINPTFTVPGPAVANDVLFATYRATDGVILPALGVCQFSLRRSGPDGNPNDFRFIFAVFVLEEVA